MVDPFESLRHDAEGTGSTAIDPRFRAELLAEARRRLSSQASTDSIRPRVTADTPTPTQMEPIPMLAKHPKKTRPILLAAACVVLIAAGAVAVFALAGDDDEPPAPAETVRSTATITSGAQQPNPTEPATIDPGIVEPTTISSTTIPPDQQIAHDILLRTDEYASGWYSATTSEPVSFDPEVARGIDECRPFMTSVFDPVAATPHDVRMWAHAAPPALFGQYVVVLPDIDAARTLFTTLNGAEFGQCSAAYLAAGPFLPSFFHESVVEPPGGAVGDDIVFRRYPYEGTDELGQVHNETDLDASIRVGRALIFIGTVTSLDGEEVVSEDDFHDILVHVVERASSALGVPIPTASPDDTEIADAVLLSGDDYGPDWVGVPNGALFPTISSATAGEIPECAPFVDTVFGAFERGASAFRTFYYAQPEAFFTQYVAVFPDADAARSVYVLVNSAEFAPCVTAYGTVLDGGQAPAEFPSAVDQPIADPPFAQVGDAMTYRTFPETWRDPLGVVNGPYTAVDAVMLVDRTITFIGTATDSGDGVVLNTTDQFRTALEHVVERATAALAGTPIT